MQSLPLIAKIIVERAREKAQNYAGIEREILEGANFSHYSRPSVSMWLVTILGLLLIPSSFGCSILYAE